MISGRVPADVVTDHFLHPVSIAARGGPAGLEAAAALHDRGHDVTLHEGDRLGGLLKHAEGSRVKQDLGALRRHLVHEVERRGIKVVQATATAESLAGHGYDGVVLAIGAADRRFASD